MEGHTRRLSESACHVRSLCVHRNGQDLKILASVSFVKLLPDWQLLSTRSPRGPSKNQDAATAKVAQPDSPLAIERLDRKVRGRLADSGRCGSICSRQYQYCAQVKIRTRRPRENPRTWMKPPPCTPGRILSGKDLEGFACKRPGHRLGKQLRPQAFRLPVIEQLVLS